MVGGAGWMAWNQRDEIRTMVLARVVHPPDGEIPLMVQHDRGALRLRWSPKVPGVKDAARGTLTIIDGTHQSRLDLDGPELHGGLASYWPDGDRVGFHLETDTGGNGFIEAPVEDMPAKPVSRPAEETAADSPEPAKRRVRPKGSASRIDDGLEWTQTQHRSHHGTRSKRKSAF